MILQCGFTMISIVYPIDSVTVKNNIFIQGPDSATDIALRYLESLPFTGTMDIDNNVFYSPNTATTIDWDGTTYTVATAEADGTIGGYMSDNLITDPQVDSNYRPAPDSDVVGGGIVPANLLDYYGKALPGSTYHIGAVWPAEAAPIYGSLLGPWLGMGGFASDVSGYGATPAVKALLLETTTGDSLVETTTGDELIEA